MTTLLLSMSVGWSCGRDDSAGSPAVAPPHPVVPPVAAAKSPPSPLTEHINADRLRTHVEWLASDRLRGRPTPSAQLDEAATYVRRTFVEHGLSAPEGLPDHEQRFECGGPTNPGAASNVVAIVPGRDPVLAKQAVMITAYYDHVREHGPGPDTIFNGANDNASGTAAMLTIAGALAAAPKPPRRTIVFVAFCGEELGLLGSGHYAEHPVWPLDSVVAQLNLEMLGRPEPGAPRVSWVTGMARSDLGAWLNDGSEGSSVRFVPGTEVGRQEGSAFDRSDNYPLALQGVIAHTIAAGRLDALYHSADDEADTLDYEGMAVVVRAVAQAAMHIADADGRPAWIDPPGRE